MVNTMKMTIHNTIGNASTLEQLKNETQPNHILKLI